MEDAVKIEQQGREVLQAYKNRTRQMAANMKGTTVGDFLEGIFPKTYQKKMPDGKIVTIDADTDEPVNQ